MSDSDDETESQQENATVSNTSSSPSTKSSEISALQALVSSQNEETEDASDDGTDYHSMSSSPSPVAAGTITEAAKPPRRKRTAREMKPPTPRKVAGVKKAKSKLRAPDSDKKTRKRRKKKPSKVARKMERNAIKAIRKAQSDTGFLLPELSMTRLVREITFEHSLTVTRWNASAIAAVRNAAEQYIYDVFRSGNIMRSWEGKKTLLTRHFRAGVMVHPPDLRYAANCNTEYA